VVEIINKKCWTIWGVKEIKFPNSNNCLGYNLSRGKEIGLVLRLDGKLQSPNSVTLTFLHELAHMEGTEESNKNTTKTFKLVGRN